MSAFGLAQQAVFRVVARVVDDVYDVRAGLWHNLPGAPVEAWPRAARRSKDQQN